MYRTMKKIYMTPQTEVMMISVEQHMLAGSILLQGKDANVTDGEYDESRGGGSWSDDDEDY